MAIVEKGVNLGPGTNVKGNYKSKGYRFGKRAKVITGKSQKILSKGAGRIAKSYKKYGKPTETLFRRTGAAALGTGKFLVKRGLFGFPGVAAGAAYYGGKALVKKGERVARRSATKQWQKRDRFGRTRWYL